jgi:hypothetical protein
MPRENVFLPVTTKMIISVTKIVSVPEIVRITKIVRVPEIVSVSEVDSGISLVPYACGDWISVIREPPEPISLVDICSREWTRTGKRCPISVNRRLAKPIRPVRAHSK